jgi:2-amino-4-hydroxy-6-hydroxymethyldihydropteridine diphosphokinase
VIAAVALGSNLGDRVGHLDYAAVRLRDILGGVRISRYIETDPVGATEPQPRYLNAAAVGQTALPPRELLDCLLTIERERGRERPHPNAPRTLDLDLIVLGELVIDEPDLVVPHPRFRERRFVLEPLAEIAPELRDPVSGMTMNELLRSAGL